MNLTKSVFWNRSCLQAWRFMASWSLRVFWPRWDTLWRPSWFFTQRYGSLIFPFVPRSIFVRFCRSSCGIASTWPHPSTERQRTVVTEHQLLADRLWLAQHITAGVCLPGHPLPRVRAVVDLYRIHAVSIIVERFLCVTSTSSSLSAHPTEIYMHTCFHSHRKPLWIWIGNFKLIFLT